MRRARGDALARRRRAREIGIGTARPGSGLRDNGAMADDDTRRARALASARSLAAAVPVGALVALLCGCGSSAAPSTAGAGHTTSVPAYVTEPFTHEQQLVEQGARLVVADGCAACHLDAHARTSAPSFSSFAGHHVTLTDGRSVLVDEHFLEAGMLDPRANELKGYDPAPMLAALARVGLSSRPRQVAALAAFIEQVGPEPEPPG
jgi:cytochrome c553